MSDDSVDNHEDLDPEFELTLRVRFSFNLTCDLCEWESNRITGIREAIAQRHEHARTHLEVPA